MSREARALSVRIDRSAAEAYEFLALPENFPKWASWIARTADSPAAMRFSERNSYGVLDHQVRLARGAPIYVPLRVVAQGEGCELVLTLFRRPEMSDEKFAADAEWVMRDLQAAKRLLEAQ
jgi:hypothetical protein